MKNKILKSLLLLTLTGTSLYGVATKTEISQLYVSLFNRASEGEGNKYWQNRDLSIKDTAEKMLATPDARSYFGSNLEENRDFIVHIYLNTLNKTPEDDPNGINYWVNLLDEGLSRGRIVASFINSATKVANAGDAQDQFNNRVEVSNYMADHVEDVPVNYATTTSFSGDLRVNHTFRTVEFANQLVGLLKDKELGYITPTPTIDETPPVITIIGENSITIEQYSTYSDAGAEATDNIDERVEVTSTSSVDTDVVGDYIIIYSAVDKAGNDAKSKEREINVIKKEESTTPTTPMAKDIPNPPAVPKI